MSQKKGRLVPQLRFPEFRGSDGWGEKSLRLIAEVKIGQSPSSQYFNEMGDGLPLLQGNADIEDGVSKPRVFTTQITKACKPGDILLSVRAPAGNVAISKHKACIGRGFAALDAIYPNNQEYLFQWLMYYENNWKRISQGAAFEAINADDIRSVAVSIPSPTEQQHIADCLSSLDSLITAESRQLDALKEHKKGLMQQLFPQEGEKVPQLRFSEFRESVEWKVKPLSGVAALCSEKISATLIDKAYYVSTENLLPDFLGVTPAEKEPAITSATSFSKGDILVSNIRPYLKKACRAHFDGTASNDVLVFRAKPCLSQDYLAVLLCSDIFIDYVMLGAKGVKMPRGDISMMLSFPTPVPGVAEQTRIADCLFSLDDLIFAQSRKVDTLKIFKQGLLGQLFPEISP